MKTLTALFTAAALTLTAGLAQADMSKSQIDQLVKDGKIKPLESLDEVVMKLHPGATITDRDVDNHFNKDDYEYEVELRDAQGQEWDVDLNAKTGEVLKNDKDD